MSLGGMQTHFNHEPWVGNAQVSLLITSVPVTCGSCSSNAGSSTAWLCLEHSSHRQAPSQHLSPPLRAHPHTQKAAIPALSGITDPLSEHNLGSPQLPAPPVLGRRVMSSSLAGSADAPCLRTRQQLTTAPAGSEGMSHCGQAHAAPSMQRAPSLPLSLSWSGKTPHI